MKAVSGGAEEGAAGGLAVVFLDGEYEDGAYYRRLAQGAAMLVAADGGARFLLDQGLRPDIVVGDFDSLAAADVERLAEAGVELARHPVRKDQTDGELAADEAVRRGAVELVLAGALGALDHTLGHLALLRRLSASGLRARIASPRLSVCVLVAPAAIALSGTPGTRVSLVPLGGDSLVTLTGLDYTLERETLPADSCLGLGNSVAAGAQARIRLHGGVAAVLAEDGGEVFAPTPMAVGG